MGVTGGAATIGSAPKVSVLMPVFDERPDLLGRAIESVRGQTWRELELVLADDGSEQAETVELLRHHAAADDRVKLHRLPHQGITRTLNAGLSLCAGELICRHDSDDWSEPQRVAGQVRFLDEHPELAMVGCNAMLHQEDGTVLWPTDLPREPAELLRRFPSMNPFCHGAVCLRRSAVERLGGYRAELDCSQDYDLFWRLCERFGGANLPDVWYHHRRTAASISARRSREQARVSYLTRRLARMRAEGGPEDFPAAAAEADRWLSAQPAVSLDLGFRADQCLLAGRYRQALDLCVEAIRAGPLRPIGYLRVLRALVFVSVPCLRQSLFRGAKDRVMPALARLGISSGREG
ncbi:MAG: glycosyltransferase [Candidatus Riflebacteria bacterium]|nr:glycosyltransferase [Candidatus Riflebacteria bacterium]